MNKKELKEYSDEMIKKLNYHYWFPINHEIRYNRIKNSSKLKLNLISKLKEHYDLIIEQCKVRQKGEYNINWFDIYIPTINLSIKICENREECNIVFKRWRKHNIVLIDSSKDKLSDCLEQIISKMCKMSKK